MPLKAKMWSVLSILTLIAFALPASAQRARSGATPRPDPLETIKERNKQTIERDAILSESRKPPPTARANASALAKVRQDYVRIQVLSNELMKAVALGGTLNYKQIAERAAEIKERASRLKKRLALADSDEESQRAKDEAEFRSAPLSKLISMLSERIHSFVSNPFFKNPRVVTPEQALAVSHDLRSIIALSLALKKKCRELRKSL